MVPFIMMDVPDILQQKQIGVCINRNKDGYQGGMIPDRQNVIRCIDSHPLASIHAGMRDYDCPQNYAILEFSDALVILNSQAYSQQYGDQVHVNGWPLQVTFAGNSDNTNSYIPKFQTQKAIHLFARVHKRDPFKYCGRLQLLHMPPVMIGETPTWRFDMLDVPNPPPQTFMQFLINVYDAPPVPTSI